MLQSSWSHPQVTRMVQHMQINQCDTPYLQKKRQKLHYLNRCRKTFEKFNIINTIQHDKTSHQKGYRGNISQHNTTYDKSTANNT